MHAMTLPPALFDFLRELRDHNERAWFTANKDRYEQQVRGPCLDFIRAVGDLLPTFAPSFVAEPRPVGGSLFRIQRDTRFAHDKAPYKTNIGMQFRHRDAQRDVHAPGFYLHVEPGQCFIGAGMWHPDGPTLQRIRARIIEQPAAWAAARAGLSLGGDRLKRPPAGIAADHPLVEDLKFKDFVVMAPLTEADVLAAGFLDHYVGVARSHAPLVRFLCGAVGLPY